jgi:hypothetical protein
MTRPLNSDELGEKGERLFSHLCNDAHLVCTKITRDRTGVDFIVEFPFPNDKGSIPLDRRPQPPESRVQVKTVWEGQSAVRLRLSSAERLAKLRQNACIFVFSIRNDLSFATLHCVHVMDDALASILKKVRECEAKDTLSINRTEIRLNFRALGKEITPSGGGIGEIIEQSFADGYDSYIRKKTDQIENLGATAMRYAGQFEFQTNNVREIADVFLGLRAAKVSNFSMSETRFDNKLPISPEPSEATIRVHQAPKKGEVIFRNRRTGETVRLKADFTFAGVAPKASQYTRIRVSHDYLTIDIERNPGGPLSVQIETKSDPVVNIDRHFEWLKIQTILASACQIELVLDRKHAVLGDIDRGQMPVDMSAVASNSNTISIVAKITDAAGSRDFLVSGDDINAYIGEIDFVNNLLTVPHEVGLAPFYATVCDAFASLGEQLEDILVIGNIAFRDRTIAYCARGILQIAPEGCGFMLKVSRLRLRELRLIETDKAHFDNFIKDMQVSSAIATVLRIEKKDTPTWPTIPYNAQSVAHRNILTSRP